MRLVIVLLISVCCLGVYAQEETIAWSTTDTLQWVNFKAEPNLKMEAAAITASGLTFGYSVKHSNNVIYNFTAEVYAHFYPNKSWVKAGRDTDYILAHEQLHFDITELHARMLRKELSQLRINNNIRRRIEQINQRVNMDLDKMQNIYDSSTNHSNNTEVQLQWQRDVKEALKSLEEYADPKINVGVN